MKYMLKMQHKKLNTPNACMFFTSLNLYFRFLICPCIFSFLLPSLYWLCRFLTTLANARKRLVYASITKLIAGKKSAGVLIVISIAGKIQNKRSLSNSWIRVVLQTGALL